MTTEAQITANRNNAQTSTGPRTPEGKAKVAQNAVKHGLLAREAVVTGEDMDQFDLFRNELRADLAPVGLVESLLAERIVGLFWRLQRAERFHTGAFDTLYAQCAAHPLSLRGLPEPGPHRGDPIFGTTVVRDFSQTKVLERLLGYERRIEYSLYRTMAELRNLRKEGGVSRERKSGKCEVPSLKLENSASISPGLPTVNFPLPTYNSPIPASDSAATEPPDGVGTNVADVERQLCETKPITEVSSLQCQVPSEQSQTATPPVFPFSLPTSDSALECQGSRQRGQAASPPSLPTSDFTLETAAKPPSCETKPICARVIKDGEGYRPIFRRRR